MSGYFVVNKPVQRVDARSKVTGRALYAADIQLEGMLYGKTLFSSYAHARVKGVDVSEAVKLPGVKAVLTAKDVPGDPHFGNVIQHQHVLVDDKVRYYGDAVAIAAAETEALARKALALVKVEYEELPAVFDPEEALKPGSPLVHEDVKNNLCIHYPVRKGDVEQGFSESDLIIEREYSTQFIEHSYIEPEAVVAVPDALRGTIVIYGSFQNIFSIRKSVARVLGIDLSRVRLVQCTLGGSFGGKDEVMHSLAARAGMLALATGRPVKMVNSREESIVESYKRHPYKMRYKVGVSRDGFLKAMEVEMICDAGAYASMTPFVPWRSTVQATGPYEVPHVKVDTYGVYTNNTYTGAMRGFGSPQACFGNESLMDEIAFELGMDPVEFRLKNVLKNGSVTATGQVLDTHEVSVERVIREAVERSDFARKRQEYAENDKDPVRRGIGLAVSYRGVSLGAEGTDATGAIVSVQSDGSVIILSGLVEMGQGLRTVFSQIAAEELGISVDKVTFLDTDTSLIPDGGPTVASRSTLMGGNAMRDAAGRVRQTIHRVAAERLKCSPGDLEAADGQIWVSRDPSRRISFEEAVRTANQKGLRLAEFGWYQAPKVSWDAEKGCGNAYFTYVYGCQVAEVVVDTRTGKVDVTKVTAVHDVGFAVNPENVKGQIYGGVAMGIGYGLLEDLELKDGRTRTLNFDEYLIPTIADVGDIEAVIVENPDPYGPYGAKSIAEPATELMAPAIANAVFHATGRRIADLPLDLERVLLGHSLRSRRGGRGSENK